MASSSVPRYTVFISHAGTDKYTIAIPLREKLMSHNISAFVDEADMAPGMEAEPAMIQAMETVEIAVVVLSPEFIARKWPMRELMCFLRRREETREGSRCVPVIIPFFYRLSVSDLYDEPRLDRVDADGNSLYLASRFLERLNSREPETQMEEIKAALHKVHGIMGVRNDDGASNESTCEMDARRERLLDILCERILNAVPKAAGETTAKVRKEEALSETFRAHFEIERDMRNFVFNFSSRDENGHVNTNEGQVLEKLVDESPGVNRVIAIEGISGVGKTSLLRALCGLKEVKIRFQDGVYSISMGTDCTLLKLIEALSAAVEKSGGRRMANKMRAQKDAPKVTEQDVLKVTGMFRSWFHGRQYMIAVDDVWLVGEITTTIISALVGIHESGRDSKLMLTTRSMEVAWEADTYIRMEPREPLGCESKAILLRTSAIKTPEDENEDSKAINEVLTRCGGLPLFLAAAGKSVDKLGFRRELEGCAAYRLYAQILEENMRSLLDTDVDEHKGLSAALMKSIAVVEQRKNVFGLLVPVGMRELHRRLSVFEKHALVPMTVLKRLWQVKNEMQAAVIAKEFERVALANVEFEKRGSRFAEVLRLPDSVYKFAVAETRKHEEEKLGHEKLLERYGMGLKWRGYYREWWSTLLQPDGYIHEQLCRHLTGAGRYRELIELLLCPEWACRVVMVSGVFSVEEDLSLGIRVLQDLHKEGEDIFSDSSSLLSHLPFQTHSQSPFETHFQSLEALELVLEAVTLSRDFLDANPEETWFQLHGRLVRKAQRISSVGTYPVMLGTMTERLRDWWNESTIRVDRTEAYVKRMEEGGPKPRVRSVNPSLAQTGGVATRILRLNIAVECMAAMVDGTWAACGCCDGRIIVLDLIRVAVQTEWQAHSLGVLSIAITRDGKQILSGSYDERAKVWDVESRQCVATFRGHEGPVDSVAFLGDGNRAVSSAWNEFSRIWDTSTGRTESQQLKLPRCRRIAVFPDGERVVTGIDYRLQIWNAMTGAKMGPDFDGHTHVVESVAVTMDGKRIVSGSWDGTVRIWCAETHSKFAETGMDGSYKNHSKFAETGMDGSYKNGVVSLNVRADGKRILAGSKRGIVFVLDAKNMKEACDPLVGHCSSVIGVSFLPDGNSFLSCSEDGTVRLWDLRRNDIILGRHPSPVSKVSFMPDGIRAVSECGSEKVQIWDIRTGRQLSELFLLRDALPPENCGNLINADDRTRSYYVSRDDYVLDVDSRTLVSRHPAEFCHYCCFEFTSSPPLVWQVVTGSDDGTVTVWDLRSPDRFYDEKYKYTLGQHDFPVKRVFVSDDGLRAVSVDSRDNISLWDIRRKQRIRQLTARNAPGKPRRWIMDAIGEVVSDNAGLDIPLNGYQIMHFDGRERRVLATMESKVTAWALSPDRRIICAGMHDGRVAFLRLEA